MSLLGAIFFGAISTYYAQKLAKEEGVKGMWDSMNPSQKDAFMRTCSSAQRKKLQESGCVLPNNSHYGKNDYDLKGYRYISYRDREKKESGVDWFSSYD